MISTIVMVSILIGGFWSVASPREDINRINMRFSDYVTLREYDHQVKQLEDLNKEQNARTAAVERLKLLEKVVEDLAKDHKDLSKAVTGAVTLSDTLKSLKEDQERMRERLNKLLISPSDLVNRKSQEKSD